MRDIHPSTGPDSAASSTPRPSEFRALRRGLRDLVLLGIILRLVIDGGLRETFARAPR